MNIKILCAIAACVVTSAVPAAAADYPLKAAAPAFSWTGPYIGVHGGYGWGTFFPPTAETGHASEIDLRGGFGGLQAGFNYQVAPNWLFGVEQDIWFGKISGGQVQPFPAPEILFESNVGGTIRGRFGLVRDRVLLYSTAGIAWVVNKGGLNFQNAAQQAAAGADALSYSQTRWHYGVAVGNGLEVAVDRNVSIKAEYLLLYLTKEQYFSGTTEAALAGSHVHTFRLGLNWLLH